MDSRIRQNQWVKDNLEHVREYKRDWARRYRENNRQTVNENARAYRAKNADRLRDYQRRIKHRDRDKINARNKQRRLENIEEYRARDRVKYLKSKESICASKRRYYKTNRVKCLTRQRSWRLRNTEHRKLYRNRYNKTYRSTDKYRLEHALRMRIWSAIRIHTKGRSRKCEKTMTLIGCPLADLKIYLESKFESGMSWENYGSVWEIDHIMPCAIFDLSKPEHQKRCFHFSNLRPCFEIENIKKGKKVLSNQFNLI